MNRLPVSTCRKRKQRTRRSAESTNISYVRSMRSSILLVISVSVLVLPEHFGCNGYPVSSAFMNRGPHSCSSLGRPSRRPGSLPSDRNDRNTLRVPMLLKDSFVPIVATEANADGEEASSSDNSNAGAAQPEPVLDNNGNEFLVGSTVRVVEPGLKAFQVSSKGQGSFDEGSKEFIPSSSPSVGGFLLLPPGLCGVVTKIYNVDEISANFPVQVKFAPGSNEGEYDTPVPFLMHFQTNEIEVIS